MLRHYKRAGRLRLLLTALVATAVSVVGVVGSAYATTTTDPARTGVLEICKVGSGQGVTGTFGFTVQATGVQSQRVEVPVNGCSFAMPLPVGTATVTEQARPGYSLAGIVVDPAERRVSQDPGADPASVKVSIVRGDISNQTMVTFTNKVTPKGFLKLCKEKPRGDTLTGWFTFTISQAGFPTLTKSIPVGECKLIQLFAGEATVTEVERSNTVLVNVTSNRPATVNLPSRTARVQIATGSSASPTILTFINKDNPPPPTTGHVVICKEAGPGVDRTMSFTFTLPAGVPSVQLKPGECKTVELPLGPQTITERATNGLQVASIQVTPQGAAVGQPDTTTGTVTVRVTPDPAKITVRFTNKVAPPGRLKVCKVAGDGVVNWTPFSFTVGDKPVTVQTGSCSLPMTVPAGTLTISENKPDGMRVSNITVAGASQMATRDLGGAKVTINVASSLVTEVIFTNTRPSSPVHGCVWSRASFTGHRDVVGHLVPNGGLAVGSDRLNATQTHYILRKAGYSTNYRFRLQGQMITTQLNQLGGASTPASVQNALNASQLLMSQGDGALHNGAVNNLSIRQGDTVRFNGRDYKASQLMDTLRDYNRSAIHGCPNPCGQHGYDRYTDKHRGSHGPWRAE